MAEGKRLFSNQFKMYGVIGASLLTFACSGNDIGVESLSEGSVQATAAPIISLPTPTPLISSSPLPLPTPLFTPTPITSPVPTFGPTPIITPVATPLPITPTATPLPAPSATAMPIIGNIANGQALFTDKSCAGCHDIAFNGSNIWAGVQASILSDAIANVGIMATLYASSDTTNGTQFTDQELYDLAAYIEAAQAPSPEPTPTTEPITMFCDAEIAVRRTKNLLTGLAPTADETIAVVEDPDVLKDRVTEWLETDEFKGKMLTFFKKNLQQTSTVQEDYAFQITSKLADRWEINDSFVLAMNESISRTALWIIENDRPFSEIASTRTWMMTTQMMAYLAAAESSGDIDGLSFYHNPVTVNGIDYDANTPHATQIRDKMIYSQTALDSDSRVVNCPNDPQVISDLDYYIRRHWIFSAFMDGNHRLICGGSVQPQLFTASDSMDWRPVTMVRGEPADWWDALAFRNATELTLKSSRTGFFSHPAFLATWRSNEDNDFRVTTNQALIAGLGRAFEETDISIPLGNEGLSDDHASPDTDCYSCHKTLDPMRTYFDVDFDPVYYGTNPKLSPPDYAPSFSFLGHSGAGSDLEDFGRHIAEHPYFATAWVQKVCAYANAENCDVSNPEFQRVVSVFENSNLNFKTMITELFASTLIANAPCAEDFEQDPSVSLTRLDHFCPTLVARTGISNICALNSTAVLANSLPADSWSRGADKADRATDPGMFYRATTEALCSEISSELVNKTGYPVQVSDIDGSIDWLVEGFMGVSRSDTRFADLRAALQGHYDNIAEVSTTSKKRLESVTTLACVSPFLTSTDF